MKLKLLYSLSLVLCAGLFGGTKASSERPAHPVRTMADSSGTGQGNRVSATADTTAPAKSPKLSAYPVIRLLYI